MSNAGFVIDKYIQSSFGMSLQGSHKTFSLPMKIDNLFLRKFNLLNKWTQIVKSLKKMMIILIFMDSLQIGNLKKCMKSKNFVKRQIKINQIFFSFAKRKD